MTTTNNSLLFSNFDFSFFLFCEGFARTALVFGMMDQNSDASVFLSWMTTMVEASRVFHCGSGRRGIVGVRWKSECEVRLLEMSLTELFDKRSVLWYEVHRDALFVKEK